ncbi:MAG: hypothetical protein IRY99_14415 [Isosphaeraceae bacterium]|nr:hypothetical protein [Isosphaeraceae bacterium]
MGSASKLIRFVGALVFLAAVALGSSEARAQSYYYYPTQGYYFASPYTGYAYPAPATTYPSLSTTRPSPGIYYNTTSQGYQSYPAGTAPAGRARPTQVAGTTTAPASPSRPATTVYNIYNIYYVLPSAPALAPAPSYYGGGVPQQPTADANYALWLAHNL